MITNPISKKKTPVILLIEDDRAKARSITRWLGRAYPHVGVSHVVDLEAAKAMMAEFEFDMMITDGNFPVERGAEDNLLAYRYALREAAERNIPAVVVSCMPKPSGETADWVQYYGTQGTFEKLQIEIATKLKLGRSIHVRVLPITDEEVELYIDGRYRLTQKGDRLCLYFGVSRVPSELCIGHNPPRDWSVGGIKFLFGY